MEVGWAESYGRRIVPVKRKKIEKESKFVFWREGVIKAEFFELLSKRAEWSFITLKLNLIDDDNLLWSG